MPYRCCVPNCTSGYSTNPENCTFFSTKDKEVQEKWSIAIPRKDFKVRSTTRVCCKHFSEEDIIKGKFIDVSGKKEFFPFLKWTLKPGSIPTIFPSNYLILTLMTCWKHLLLLIDCPHHLTKTLKTRKPPASRNLEHKKKKRRIEESSENIDSFSEFDLDVTEKKIRDDDIQKIKLPLSCLLVF